MIHRVWLTNGRYYDTDDQPRIDLINTLVRIQTVGKFSRTVMIHKDHIVAIEVVPNYDPKQDGMMTSQEWNNKIQTMEKNKSKKKFKDQIKYAQRRNIA